jgi:hypothetical protein
MSRVLCAVGLAGILCTCASSSKITTDVAGAAAGHKVALSMDSLIGRALYAHDGDFLKEFESNYPRLERGDRVVAAVTIIALFPNQLDGESSLRYQQAIRNDREAIRQFMASRTPEQVAGFCRWNGTPPDVFRREVERLLE